MVFVNNFSSASIVRRECSRKIFASQSSLIDIGKMVKWSLFSLEKSMLFSKTSGCISLTKVSVNFFKTWKNIGISIVAFGSSKRELHRRATNAKKWLFLWFVLIIKFDFQKNNRFYFLHQRPSKQIHNCRASLRKCFGEYFLHMKHSRPKQLEGATFWFFLKVRTFVLQDHWLKFFHHVFNRRFFTREKFF